MDTTWQSTTIPAVTRSNPFGDRFYPDGTDGKGYYFQPTIFTNATNDMRIAQEEIFGPVLSVIPCIWFRAREWQRSDGEL